MIDGGSGNAVEFEAGGNVFVLRVLFDADTGVVRMHLDGISMASAHCSIARQQPRRPRPRRQRACPR